MGRVRRHFGRAAVRTLGLPLVLSAVLLAGCGDGDGAQVSCNLQECTVTFPRGVEASASVFGVEAKLVEVRNGWVTLEIGGTTVTVPVGGEAEGVRVREVTSDKVVVAIPHGIVG
jgi:hypothetical protein